MSEKTYGRLSPASQEKGSFRDSYRSSRRSYASVHLIPTPEGERKRPPRWEPLILRTWVVMALTTFMISLAITVEVALHFSNKRQGFAVPEKNVFTFVPTSFLLSFFPVLFVVPLTKLWAGTNWGVQTFQPYVMLSKGDGRAEDTILLDYMALNNWNALVVSAKRRHWLVLISLTTVFLASFLQPLAGSVFTLATPEHRQETVVTSERALGLASNFQNLNAFSSAAGFADAKIYQGLPDPPFVAGGWAVAQFQIPITDDPAAAVEADVAGIETQPNCSASASSALTNISSHIIPQLQFHASLADGCSAGVQFNPNDSNQQYGVVAVDPRSCGLDQNANIEFLPVMFWFFHSTSEQGQNVTRAKGIICRPAMTVQTVQATVNVSTVALTSVKPRSAFNSDDNNITGDPLNGRPMNGVLFPQANDTFVQSRAVSISIGLPGTIYRNASLTPGFDGFFDDESTAFLSLTSSVYQTYLSVIAKTVYFVPVQSHVSADLINYLPRLVIQPLAAHGLAAVLLAVGIVGMLVHLVHRHARRGLYLTAPPGSIGASMALAFHAGFGSSLTPYDDGEAIGRKLRTMRFSMDRRTGAILAEEVDEVDAATPLTYSESEETVKGFKDF